MAGWAGCPIPPIENLKKIGFSYVRKTPCPSCHCPGGNGGFCPFGGHIPQDWPAVRARGKTERTGRNEMAALADALRPDGGGVGGCFPYPSGGRGWEKWHGSFQVGGGGSGVGALRLSRRNKNLKGATAYDATKDVAHFGGTQAKLRRPFYEDAQMRTQYPECDTWE